MTELQDLLNQEALLSNTGYGDSNQRQHLHTIIRLVRDETRRPHCFGDDDCSTIMLSQCPWRMDCGS
jgi:hypothetical protein